MAILRVVLIKPSKYSVNGTVERFKKGFMPNATLYHMASMTPPNVGNVKIELHTIDEYVHDNLDYLALLRNTSTFNTLLCIVGVQSHQFHRALDLAAYAKSNGVRNCIVGGPHPMTCKTDYLWNSGISFALAEAEVVWEEILFDAINGELKSAYGLQNRWQRRLDGPVISPPNRKELRRYVAPLLGIYPVRGCPYKCNYCSVIKISGRHVRSVSIDTTMRSLLKAKSNGIQYIMFVSDNFNKYPAAKELLQAMIDEKLGLKFFCQCDTQIADQPELINLLGKANCYEIFVGVESFNGINLKSAHKFHNKPKKYNEIVKRFDAVNIRPHFSNIIGFPTDKEEDIYQQLELLKELAPRVASFYILTPIPGTEQYDEFLSKDLIWEKNLDRFDTTCLTWRHQHLSRQVLSDLLYYCYTDYYGWLLKNRTLNEKDKEFVIFNRFSASQRFHPMAGGIGRIILDSSDDYIELRKTTYGFEYSPLPESSELSENDLLFNRKASWTKKGKVGVDGNHHLSRIPTIQ